MPQAYPKVATHSNRRIRRLSRAWLIRAFLTVVALYTVTHVFNVPFRRPFGSPDNHSRSSQVPPFDPDNPDIGDDPDDYFPCERERPLRYLQGHPITVGREYFPFQRLTMTSEGTTVAACWPSYGGLWATEVTPLELEWLGLPTDTGVDRRLDRVEEDIFCARLEQLGAAWYELPPRFRPRDLGGCASHVTKWDFQPTDVLREAVPQIEAVGYEIARPNYGGLCMWHEEMLLHDATSEPDHLEGKSGGSGSGSEADQHVWAYLVRQRQRRDYARGLWHRVQAETSIRNAMSMEDRCDAMLKYGGKYCRSGEDCPEIARLFGIPLGENGTCPARKT